MISLQIMQNMKKIVSDNVVGYVDAKRVYLYRIPEQLDVMSSLPMIKLDTVLSDPYIHSSDKLKATRESFQLQLFFDENDEKDFETMVQVLDSILEDNGFYYTTGYDSYDPDYEGILTITRQYNYRNILN